MKYKTNKAKMGKNIYKWAKKKQVSSLSLVLRNYVSYQAMVVITSVDAVFIW